MIPEWVSIHVYIEVLILDYSSVKALADQYSPTNPRTCTPNSVPESARTSFARYLWIVLLWPNFRPGVTTGMNSFWNDLFRNEILVGIM